MVFFIFILLLMFSLSGVLYLMVRALPRVPELEVVAGDGKGGSASPQRHNFLDRWAHSEIPEKIDSVFNDWFLKFLRKFKVFTLKLDNMISQYLRKIHHEQETAEKKSAIDFKEITESKKDE